MNKIALITGGTSGLGYETAKSLAEQGWTVFITSRRLERAERAANELNTLTKANRVKAQELDLASQTSIRALAQVFKQSGQTLSAVVCNAGVTLNGATQYTEEGIEKTFGVNHLGHFLLVNLLLDRLLAPARIVCLSSGTHVPDHKLARSFGMPAPVYTSAQTLAYPQDEQGGMNTQSLRYTTSKLCNVLFANELARRLHEQGLASKEAPINVYSIDPGLMPDTGLSGEYPRLLSLLFKGFVSLLQPFHPGIRTAQQSAKDVVRLLTDPALKHTSGTYYDGLKETAASPLAYERDRAIDLWETSVKLVNLTKEEAALL